jgi:hypothetical protein
LLYIFTVFPYKRQGQQGVEVCIHQRLASSKPASRGFSAAFYCYCSLI